jgi:hypothetical protein
VAEVETKNSELYGWTHSPNLICSKFARECTSVTLVPKYNNSATLKDQLVSWIVSTYPTVNVEKYGCFLWHTLTVLLQWTY